MIIMHHIEYNGTECFALSNADVGLSVMDAYGIVKGRKSVDTTVSDDAVYAYSK